MGTKKIINDGAHLITNGWEVCQFLRKVNCLVKKDAGSQAYNFNSELEKQIYDRLKSQILCTDQLSQNIGCRVDRVAVALSLMEIEGVISRLGNQWIVNN